MKDSGCLEQRLCKNALDRIMVSFRMEMNLAPQSLSYTIANVDPNDSGFWSQFRALTGREFVADLEGSG